MMKYQKYVLVTDEDPDRFQAKVQEYLNKGFEVRGHHVMIPSRTFAGLLVYSISLVEEYHSDSD